MDNQERIPESVLTSTSFKVNDFNYSDIGLINIEEDVLVPDTKPDLKEILLIDANIEEQGNLALKITYSPEKENDLVAIDTKISLARTIEDMTIAKEELKLWVEKVEYLVVNERKFRVKVSLKGRILKEKSLDVQTFNNDNKQIQLKKETIEITELSLKKIESLEIDETIQYKDTLKTPAKILASAAEIVPGYKQITSEKIVLNGNVYLNLLLLTVDDQGEESYEQLQSKVEFTQFIPISNNGPWSGSNVSFENSQLNVEIEDEQLKLKGKIVALAQLFKNIEREITVDGYHMEDELQLQEETINYKTLVGNGAGEVSCREIINVSEGEETVEKVIFTEGKVYATSAKGIKGKVNISCKIHGNLLWVNTSGEIKKHELDIPVSASIDVPGVMEEDFINENISIKDIWAEKISNNQIEYNSTLVMSVQAIRGKDIIVVNSPALIKSTNPKKASMTVYVSKRDDDLWKIAKTYKTTIKKIQEVNNIETESLGEGQKILIV